MNFSYTNMGWATAFIVIFGCGRDQIHSRVQTRFDKQNNTLVSLMYGKPELDSIILPKIPSSLVGNFCISKGRILFVDKKLSMLYEFDTAGRYLGNHIGHGNGANQLPIKHIEFFTPMPDGGFLFIGPSFDCFFFDKQYRRVDDFEMNWHRSSNDPGMLPNPDPNTTDPYTPAYVVGKIFTDGKSIYFPLLCQHRRFNPTYPSYASSAKILAEMDLNDGYITSLSGALSPTYLNSKTNATLAYATFEALPENKMAISYPADSSLYLATRDFQIIRCFGKSGRALQQNYSPLTSIEDFWRIWYQNTQEHGYYREIKYIDERRLLFRSYQKNGTSSCDGMQIYKSDTLVADFDTPRGFDVCGYIAPFFYSNAFIDEEKSEIKIYKFKLK